MSLHVNPQIDPMFNTQWITPEDKPDPSPLPHVLGWQILLRPVNVRSQTKGGILLPDIVKDDMHYLNTVARVLDVGPLAFRQEDFYLYIGDSKVFSPWVKVGDYVLYGKNSGKRITYKGVKLVVIQERDLVLKLDDPNFLDPSY